MERISVKDLHTRINALENRLEESEQLIDAIKSGEVDAFAINKNNESEIYTLQSVDYTYRVLIEEIGVGAINITEEGLIVFTNPYFSKLLKLPYDKVIGHSIFDFIDKDSLPHFKDFLKESIYGKSGGEIFLRNKDGMVPVFVTLTSLQPKLANVGIIITDLSENKRNEKLILGYQENLEQKNKELTNTNAELGSFVYIASHDLQEPLRKIQTFISRLLDMEGSNLSDKGQDYFSRIQSAASRMKTLIEDLLSYSRTNTMERKFVPTDLKEIVAEVKDDLSEELKLRDANIVAENLCKASIIPFQFRQLLHNLISNSLKFSKPGEPPRIHIEATRHSTPPIDHPKLAKAKAYCHLQVSDNGIGFSPRYSDKIFELFQRLHDRNTFQGTGIGLAIVKKIVENHDGVVLASSAVNKGATFHIYFPTT